MEEAGLGVSTIPSIFIYITTYLAVLSKVDHKELRFYAPVAQLGCFAQAYGCIQFWRIKGLRPVFRLAVILIMVVDGVKLIFSIIQYQGIYYSMLEPYNIFNGRSPHLYIGPPDPKTGKSTFETPHSIYYFDKFEQPVHLLSHSPINGLQTTSMYQPFRQPIFVNKRIPDLTKLVHPANPDLTFPMINSPWINNDNTLYAYIHLYHMFEYEGVYPEYLWGHYGECLPQPQL